MVASLLCLPPELLHHTLRALDPRDLVALRGVCRRLHDFVVNNQRLCRDIYLNHYDEPENTDLDWQQELQDLIRLFNICERLEPAEKKERLGFVLNTVERFLKNASSAGYTVNPARTHCASRNASLLRSLFADDSNREAFLQQSFLFERVRHESHQPLYRPKVPRQHHQQSAKLHCLYGRPILNIGRLRSNRTYPFACSKVYDLREYTRLTKWGPFMNDDTDRVDWEKMEAILVVLGHNIGASRFIAKLFGDIWDTPFATSWPKSFMSSPMPDISSLSARDPYGVTGLWCRIVCFLDYNDFHPYNFSDANSFPDDLPRPALAVGEATRLIVMRIHVTGLEPPGPDDGKDLPVVYFKGVSRSLDNSWDDNANSELRGSVRLTKEGEVRWTSFSIFNGEERWRSEGIQLGGLKSARGVLGNWFDRDFGAQGPAGPTAFWKVSDNEKAQGSIRDMMPNDFFLVYSMNESEDSDPEADMEYTDDNDREENEDDDEDDEDEDQDLDFETEPGELAGLLMDAALGVFDLPGMAAGPPHEH